MGVMLDKMKMHHKLMAATAIGFSLTAAAQEQGPWRAVSQTAQSITGDVALSAASMAINFSVFPIARIRDLQAPEVSSVFDADSSSGVHGALYRLNVPATTKFMHKNTLCGSESAQWMATYVEGRQLHVAFFSGQKPPVFTVEAVSNSTDLCGTFTYAR
jgi:hypothetical protein